MSQNLIWMFGGGTLVAGAAVATFVATGLRDEAGSPASEPVPLVAQDRQAPAAQQVPVPAVEATEPSVSPTAPPSVSPQVAHEPVDETTPGPMFDVVRVAPDGGALVAGEAAPGAAVTLRLDGAQVAQTSADATGQFVTLFRLPSSDDAQMLTLEMQAADGVMTQSDDTVILTPRPEVPVVPAAPMPDVVAQESSEPAPQPVAQAPADVAADTQITRPQTAALSANEIVAVPVAEPVSEPILQAPDTPTEIAALDAPAAEPSAAEVEQPADMPTAFLVRGSGAVEVLDAAPQVMDNVVIDSISYSSQGDVQITGRAARALPEADLRIYLDNRPIALARADRGGWASDLPHVDPGVYTLRVDQISDAGQVVSRFETPFQREDPERVAAAQAVPDVVVPVTDAVPDTAAMTELAPVVPDTATTVQPATVAAPAPPVSLITVQPGHTLWAISNERYGAGELYVMIYRANRSQIRDPDMIYPGQVFALPEN